MFTFDKHSEHTPFIQFVSCAVPKDPIKEALNYIYVPESGTDIVATDGHRCHVYTPSTCPLQPGFYQVVKKNKKEIILNKEDCDLIFPDYARIIPEQKILINFKGESFGPLTIDQRYTQIIRALTENESIAYKFFSDLPVDLFIDYQTGSEFDAVLFTGPQVKAVIMPFKI